MANFECWELEIGPEFMCWSFGKVSSEPKNDGQITRVWGQPYELLILTFYGPLATLVAYVNKYTWRPRVTKLYRNEFYMVGKASANIAYSPIFMGIYDGISWINATEFAIENAIVHSNTQLYKQITKLYQQKWLPLEVMVVIF